MTEKRITKNQKSTKRYNTKRIIERQLNKEGINEPENIVQDANARVMRSFKTNRDFGPFIQN